MAFWSAISTSSRQKSDLRRETEIQAERATRRAKHEARRSSLADTEIYIRVQGFDSTFSLGGDCLIRVWGNNGLGQPVRADYFIPDCYDPAVGGAILNELLIGAPCRLRGYWKAAVQDGAGEIMVFRAQFVETAQVGAAAGSGAQALI